MRTSTAIIVMCPLTGVCSAALVEEGFGPGYTDDASVAGLAPGVTHLAVLRMTEDPGTYYDPHTLRVNPAAADVSAGDIDGGQRGVAITLNPDLDTDFASAWGALRLKTNSQNGSNILFDEFRIEESLGDIGVVPEPATMALLALGSLAVLGRRRKA